MELQTFEIRDDVPLPPPSNGGRTRKYPLAQMKPGQSFDVPIAPASSARDIEAIRTAISNSASYRKKHHGEQFATRIVRSDGAVCIRVWRTA